MFTGIIEYMGEVINADQSGGDLVLDIHCPDLVATLPGLGDSIAVNGVCLTLVNQGDFLRFDVSRESLACTRLGELASGDRVNLETALTPDKALGGHLVSGHVDGLAEIVTIQPSARSTEFQFSAAREFARFVAVKGSVCLDGISLTVNDVSDSEDAVVFSINIVPHTLEHTNLGQRSVGQCVHLEVDQIARYLDRIMAVNSTKISD